MATITSNHSNEFGIPITPAKSFFIERDDRHDFPFVGSEMRSLASWRWIVMAAVAVAVVFLPICLAVHSYAQHAGRSLVVFVLPLAVVAVLSGTGWSRWFYRPDLKDLGLIVLYTLLARIAANIASTIVYAIHPPTSHPINQSVQQSAASSDWGAVMKTYGFMTLALPGEEMFAIIPFVAIIAILYRRFRISRNTAIVIALVVTAIAFSAAHLPVYSYNLLVTFIVIFVIRVVITLSFIHTKNLWVPIGAHILFDWWSLLGAIFDVL